MPSSCALFLQPREIIIERQNRPHLAMIDASRFDGKAIIISWGPVYYFVQASIEDADS